MFYVDTQVESVKEVQHRSTAAFQQAQAMEKAGRDAAQDALYGSNVPTPEYFSQFGTSHR